MGKTIEVHASECPPHSGFGQFGMIIGPRGRTPEEALYRLRNEENLFLLSKLQNMHLFDRGIPTDYQIHIYNAQPHKEGFRKFFWTGEVYKKV